MDGRAYAGTLELVCFAWRCIESVVLRLHMQPSGETCLDHHKLQEAPMHAEGALVDSAAATIR